MKINNGILEGRKVTQVLADKNKESIVSPIIVVLCYASGLSPESMVKHLNNDNVDESAHLLITRTGQIYQMTDFNTVARHVKNSKFMGKLDINKFSIAINIENAGHLNKVGDTFYSSYNKEIPAEEVVEEKNKKTGVISYAQQISKLQIKTLNEIFKLLKANYPIHDIVFYETIC